MNQPLTRQRKTKAPCERCRMHVDLCFCELIPRIEIRTKLSLLIHSRELNRTTNTGTLAVHALVNSTMHVRGRKEERLAMDAVLDPDYEPLLFFPSEDAKELTSDYVASLTKPIQLLVPDGNWRQASKVHTRYPELSKVSRVKISSPNTQTQFLRKESTGEGMATLQAIAEAMRFLENDSTRDQLMRLYEVKLARTMKARGIRKEVQ